MFVLEKCLINFNNFQQSLKLKYHHYFLFLKPSIIQIKLQRIRIGKNAYIKYTVKLLFHGSTIKLIKTGHKTERTTNILMRPFKCIDFFLPTVFFLEPAIRGKKIIKNITNIKINIS